VIGGEGGRVPDVKGRQHERATSNADGEALRGRAKPKGPSEAQKIQKYMFEQMSFLLLFAAKNKVDDIALLVSDTERTRLRIAPKVKKVVMMADFEGRSALTVAALYGHISSVSLLLQLKADPLHVDNRGLTLMDHAIMSGNPATAEIHFNCENSAAYGISSADRRAPRPKCRHASCVRGILVGDRAGASPRYFTSSAYPIDIVYLLILLTQPFY
jgi:ankyrin repeat protein